MPSRSCASSGTNWPLVYIGIFSYTVCRLKLGKVRFDTHRPRVRPFSKLRYGNKPSQPPHWNVFRSAVVSWFLGKVLEAILHRLLAAPADFAASARSLSLRVSGWMQVKNGDIRYSNEWFGKGKKSIPF